MFLLAWRNLFHDRIRFLISLLGVAFSVLLILILLGLFRGWQEKIVSYINSTPADLWVLQEGATDFFDSVSFLPETLEDPIQKVEGVASVNPLIARLTSFTLHDEEARLFLIGVGEDGVGGPAGIVAGEGELDPGEIIIDRVFAKQEKLRIGDTLDILDTPFTIVGISKGGDFVFYQLGFINLEDAKTLLKTGDLINFYLVSLKDGANEGDVKERIADLDGMNVLTKGKFIINNQRDINNAFTPVLTVLVFLGYLVGLTIVGLITYTATVEKSREYGILKAIGVGNTQLYRIIIQQAFITGMIGFLLGAGFTIFSVSIVFETYVPQFITTFIVRDVLLVFGLTIFMSISAGYLPIRRIAGIDPAIVFKS